MSARLDFTSSEAFLESDENAVEARSVPIYDYIEGTYDAVRSGPDGREIARFIDGAWQFEDGERFSDWAVAVT